MLTITNSQHLVITYAAKNRLHLRRLTDVTLVLKRHYQPGWTIHESYLLHPRRDIRSAESSRRSEVRTEVNALGRGC